MREFHETLLGMLDAGRSVASATIVKVSGSTPRSVGARMIVPLEGEPEFTLGGGAFGQVFRGSLLPDHVVGEAIALDFGYGSAPPSGATGSRIGDTDAVTFGLGRTELAGREVPMLATSGFRLVKLYDA